MFKEAVKSGAAILAAPVTGTLKHVGAEKVVDETVSRAGLYEAQTPQVFRKAVLVDAYKRLDSTRADGTDDAYVVEQAGHPVEDAGG